MIPQRTIWFGQSAWQFRASLCVTYQDDPYLRHQGAPAGRGPAGAMQVLALGKTCGWHVLSFDLIITWERSDAGSGPVSLVFMAKQWNYIWERKEMPTDHKMQVRILELEGRINGEKIVCKLYIQKYFYFSWKILRLQSFIHQRQINQWQSHENK